jgi:transcription-repair coupling factor (superfamily II helicase)
MGLYKRIAAIECEEDREDVLDEIIDRYGEAPKTVTDLLTISLIRATAKKCGITSIIEEKAIVKLRCQSIDYLVWQELSNEFRGRLRLGGGDTPTVNFKKQSGDNVLELLLKLFYRYAEILKEQDIE